VVRNRWEILEETRMVELRKLRADVVHYAQQLVVAHFFVLGVLSLQDKVFELCTVHVDDFLALFDDANFAESEVLEKVFREQSLFLGRHYKAELLKGFNY
jgi:hypothetical protein